LLPERRQVQGEVRDVRLQRGRESRRRRHVANGFRADEVDRRRGEADQRTREEGGELSTSSSLVPARVGVPHGSELTPKMKSTAALSNSLCRKDPAWDP